MKRIILPSIIALMQCLCPSFALPLAQEGPAVGVALSGGGAKGFAHIGVLKVLEEAGIPVAVISGASMGSIIGALYAMGYSPEMLRDLAVKTDWQDFFLDKKNRRYLSMVKKSWDDRYVGSLVIKDGSLQLPSGLIAGQKIASELARLTFPAHHITDFSRLPIPFVAVATDIENGESYAIRRGFLPEALRASMAIPTIFTPTQLDNRLLVDGGLMRNLPARDVRDLGARFVIGVDVGAGLKKAGELNTFISIIDQAMSLQSAESTRNQRELCDVLIEPELAGLSFSDFDRADLLIAAGEIAAKKALPEIRKKLGRPSSYFPDGNKMKRKPLPQQDSIFVSTIDIKGLDKVSSGLIKTELGIIAPGWVRTEILDQAVSRIYSSHFFEQVSYKLEPTAEGSRLTIKIDERSTAMFRFGLRYDNWDDATLLLNTSFRNLTGHGSALTIDLKLAGRKALDVIYFVHSGLRSGIGVRIHSYAGERPLDQFSSSAREARFNVRTIGSELLVGTIFSTSHSVGLGWRGDIVRMTPTIAPPAFKASSYRLSTLFASFEMDTFDRATFPRSGHAVHFIAEYASQATGSSHRFKRFAFDGMSYLALTSDVSIFGRMQLGTLSTAETLTFKEFFLGGIDSFPGLRPDEKSGTNLQAITVGGRVKIGRGKFAKIQWGIGNTFDTWQTDFLNQPWQSGLSLGLGARTPLGPIELNVAKGLHRDLVSYVNLGFKF